MIQLSLVIKERDIFYIYKFRFWDNIYKKTIKFV